MADTPLTRIETMPMSEFIRRSEPSVISCPASRSNWQNYSNKRYYFSQR
jgi:hypothetical protein